MNNRTNFHIFFLQSPSNNATDIINNGIQFMDLNEDVQLVILENLRAHDLFRIAETNHHMETLAGIVFKKKHAGKIVKFMDPFNPYTEEMLHDNDDLIYVQRVERMLSILKHFGHLILKLSFENNVVRKLSEDQLNSIKMVNSLISSKCADTLMEFKTYDCLDDVFHGLTKPFTKVENVTLDGEFKRLGNSDFNFTDLFPAVKRLSLSPYVSNISLMDWNLTQLKHLEVHFYRNHPLHFKEEDFEVIIKKNPQIQSLVLDTCGQQFLSAVNEFLPNLEYLELVDYNKFKDRTEPGIVFKNVKTLAKYGNLDDLPSNLHFENLIELHVDSFQMVRCWWIDFAKSHSQLKKIDLKLGCIDTTGLSQFSAANLSLDEVSLCFCTDVEDETIVSFVKDNEQIKKISFNKFYSNEPLTPIADAVAEQSGGKWAITTLNNLVILEQKEIDSENFLFN